MNFQLPFLWLYLGRDFTQPTGAVLHLIAIPRRDLMTCADAGRMTLAALTVIGRFRWPWGYLNRGDRYAGRLVGWRSPAKFYLFSDAGEIARRNALPAEGGPAE